MAGMFLLVNGAFGIGKTTVGGLLARQVAGAVVYDPERVGFVLQRLPPWLLLRTRWADDFQDLAAWRFLAAQRARSAHARARVVVVPMAFSNRAYLQTFCERLGRAGPVTKVCLIAPVDMVRRRLEARAALEDADVSQWQLRRSAECCEAHADPFFGYPIDARRNPEAVVAEIRERTGI